MSTAWRPLLSGLAGLVAAIVMRLGLGAFLNRRRRPPSRTLMHAVQPLTEACLYLGALATWKYV